MASKPHASITFKVKRCEPELVAPSEPTPRELKELSDIDDQITLRFQIPIVQFYRSSPTMIGIDPVKVIRKALAKALVFYYPFAGRLRNVVPSGKFAIDCNAEGALFIEADADVTLDQLGELQPPFPCFDQLLYNVPGSAEITDSPVLLIQVSRFLCGGFSFAVRHNHTMADALGLVQLMTAIGDLAKGATLPTVLPVWHRELLNARNPPRVTCSHPEFDRPENVPEIGPEEEAAHRPFFFGEPEMSALRSSLPWRQQQRRCSDFDILAAYLWRARTMSLRLNPSEVLHGIVNVNVRSKFNPRLPKGYYGNAFAFSAARTTAGELCGEPLSFAVDLVKAAKDKASEEEFIRSMVDLIVTTGRSRFSAARPCIMSDIRNAGFYDVDFGWGNPVYGGVSGAFPSDGLFLGRCMNGCGQLGIVVPVCLPNHAMPRFIELYESLRSNSNALNTVEEYKFMTKSAL